MSNAWFRRWCYIGAIPIRWQGWAVIVAMFALFVPAAYLWMWFADTRPNVSLFFGGIAAVVGLVGNVVIYSKSVR
jgi:membrane protein YdbS with pleckstrin-like domain